MNRRLVFITLLTFLLSPAFSQSETDLYNSAFEKQLFSKIFDSEVSPSDLFLAINYNENTSVFSSILDAHLKDLEEQLQKKKTVEKKLKTIDKKTTKAFLKDYNQESSFSDLFVSKKFNSITGAALFAIILEKFGIDYVISDTPEKVVIIAEPGTTNYNFQSISPSKNTAQYSKVLGRQLYVGESVETDVNNMQYDETYQKYFVEFIYNQQIITEEEFKSNDTGTLFKKYYTLAESVNLTELAGLQYFNAGIYKFNEAEYHEALKNFRKAMMLYNESYNIINLLNISLTQVLDYEMEKRAFNPELMQLYFSINQKDSAAIRKGKDYFENLSLIYLANNNDVKGYNKYCTELFNYEINDAIEQELLEIHYNLLGKYYTDKGIEGKALQYFAKVYKINPENKDVKRLSSRLAANHAIKQMEKDIMLDTIEKYTTLLPFLNKDSRLGDIKVQCLAHMISTSFENDDFTAGLSYMDQLESYHETYPDVKYDNMNVIDAYIEASIKYYQDKKYKMSEEILTRSLKLAPDSEELQRRLKNIQSITKDL